MRVNRDDPGNGSCPGGRRCSRPNTLACRNFADEGPGADGAAIRTSARESPDLGKLTVNARGPRERSARCSRMHWPARTGEAWLARGAAGQDQRNGPSGQRPRQGLSRQIGHRHRDVSGDLAAADRFRRGGRAGDQRAADRGGRWRRSFARRVRDRTREAPAVPCRDPLSYLLGFGALPVSMALVAVAQLAGELTVGRLTGWPLLRAGPRQLPPGALAIAVARWLHSAEYSPSFLGETPIGCLFYRALDLSD